ncbi:lysophospholipid acyltransferase family protein [uncultured Rhodoblastus sp.]|uniref:lysophospholipid acyltransferase family protein n=1 Tax=uncultured Rhodoblastus sp. TaxID=543037 RepID=UPI0025DB2025|nr:lysophospholipid acyltransferase family protein [uncultured Rhodoblastus sp.]
MAPKPPSLQYRLEYAGYRLLSLFFSSLPVETASNVGGALMAFLGPRTRVRHPRLLRNLARAFPEQSAEQREQLASEVWRNLGHVLGEFFHIDEIIRDRVEIVNAEILEQIAASGKGAVLCGAHQANWEGGSAVVAKYGLKPLAVYRPLNNPFVDADFKRRRLKYYAGGLTAKHDPETPVTMIRYARSGGAVAFLVDQQTYMGVKVPFFGHMASTTPFPAMVARQCNLPLVLITGERLPGVRFRVFVSTIDTPRSEDRDADILAATAAMQTELEQSIRRHPAQWMWTHDRWF